MVGENNTAEIDGQEVVVELDISSQEVQVDPAPPAIDPTAPLSVEVETKAPVAVEDPTIDLRRQLEELSRKAEEERKAREAETAKRSEIEAYALRVAQDADRKDLELVDARIQAISSTLVAEEAEMERAEGLLRHAISKRDATLQVQAQKAIASITQRMQELKGGQEALTSQREKIAAKPPITVPPTRPAGDQREQMLSRYTPRTQSYLKDRDASWLTDPSKQNMLRSAHFAAAAQGLSPDTDAYFQAIDRHMGHGQQSPLERQVEPARRTTPAAPPTSKAASLPTGNKITVKLTPSQVDAAKNLGLSPAEYAKRIHIMSQPGWNGPRFGQNQ